VEISPRHRGRGLSRVMIGAMRDIAKRHGFKTLIAPVRPSLKERYPLTPIENYIRWTANGGHPFDPWMRVHHQLGADILKPLPRSLRITGTVGEWEEWTEMSFPESGTYVFPHGLAPLGIDRDDDRGRYWEPNVWMRHPVD
jgi:GNAT superfamily N-acetyltransferase